MVVWDDFPRITFKHFKIIDMNKGKREKILEELRLYNESSLKWWQIALLVALYICAILAGWFLFSIEQVEYVLRALSKQ